MRRGVRRHRFVTMGSTGTESRRGRRRGGARGRRLRHLPKLLACLVLALTGSGLAVGISSADSGPNVIQNGDFSQGSGSDITDWPQTVVTQSPTSGCTLTYGAGNACNGPYIDISTSMACDPLPDGTPFLAENVPDGSDGYVEQTITVPSSPGNLTFATWGNLDPANVTVSIVSASTVTPVAQFTPPPLESATSQSGCTGASPQEESIPMTAYAGQTVTLRVEGTSDPSSYDGTFANFVDFSLQTGPTTSTTTPSTTTPSTTSPTTTTPTMTTTTLGKLQSATSVFCTLDVQTSVDDCGATVADAADGVSTPTGKVQFSDGGVGSLLGSVCQLVPTPYSEGIASCVIQYRPVDTSSQPQITATYLGDSTFATSSGQQGLKSGESSGPTDDSVCVGTCSTDVTYPNEVDPVTGDPVTTSDTSKDTETATETSLVDEADLAEDEPDQHQDNAAIDWDGAGLGADQTAAVSSATTGQATYGASHATGTAATIDQGVDSQEQNLANGGAGGLASTDSDLNGAYSDSAEADDVRLRPATMSAVAAGPSPKLVLAALTLARPTKAELAAFKQDLSLATAPTYSPARGVARVTLVLGADLGVRVIAHDLGASRLSKLSAARTVTLGSVTRRLRAHATTQVTLRPTELGAQILRYLAVVGLSHHVTTELTVTLAPTKDHRHGSHVKRPIKVL